MKKRMMIVVIVCIAIIGVCSFVYTRDYSLKPLPPSDNHTLAASIVITERTDSGETMPVTLNSPSAAPSTPAPTNLEPIVTPAIPIILAKEENSELRNDVSIPVLNYHSIGNEPGNTLVLHPDKLAGQMAYLKEHDYTPLTLSDFILILEKKKNAPDKPVLLTFDDGYKDNYELAMPLLKEYGFPATLFISPGNALQPDYLNWEQVKEMHESGWDIQPHGMTHPRLSKLTSEKQKDEIVEARRQIEEQLGTTADVFCYPYGDFNSQTLTILKDAGFRYAFTIEQGRATSSQKPLQLKRIYVNGEDTLAAWSRKLK